MTTLDCVEESVGRSEVLEKPLVTRWESVGKALGKRWESVGKVLEFTR